jgi:SAM-dependent methyltransferase
MTKIHEAAARGFAADASAYARGRPDYPEALDAWLRDAAHLAAGSTVVDLGAGTGKFVPRLMTTGARIIAVEPVAQMRARLAAAFAQVDTRAGTADAIPVETASVDAVVCAQAFHWFATSAAVQEIARVVKPGGVLALVWNVRDESVPWVRRLTGIVEAYEGDAPRYHRGDWRKVFPAPGFGPLEESCFGHSHVGAAEQVIVDRFLSVSFIAALDAAGRAAVGKRLRDLVDTEPALAGRESVSMPYRTVAFRCIRDG